MKILSTLTLSTLCAVPVFADAIKPAEELIVTGELRDTEILSLANSVSLIDQEAIRTRETQQLEDLLNIAPNVNYSAGASRGRFIQIRGIGERSQFVAPINPSVGVIVDGIDMTGISAGVTAIDTQQVEIFRGPQGTLHGANALAGLINVVGNYSTDELSAAIGAGLGNYGRRDLSGYISTPFSESVGWRFAAKLSQSDGFIENDYLDRNDTNNIDELSLRNVFNLSLGEHISLDLVSYYIDTDNGYDAFSLDNNRQTLSDQPGTDAQLTFANTLHFGFDGWEIADLKTIISHADSEVDYGYDEDWSYREICAIDSDCAFWQYSTSDRYQRDNQNTALDLRLISKAGSEIDWVIGFYLRKQDVDLLRTYTNNDPDYDFYSPLDNPEVSLYDSQYSTNNKAIYAQVRLPLKDNLTLVTGLRGEQYDASFDDSNGARFRPDESLLGGKIALEYSLDSDTLLYALVSRGYKVGGFNPDDELEQSELSFDTETMLNYEVGTKGSWFDNSFQAQLALFYQDRNDVQVKQSRAYPVDGVFEFVDFIDNAAEGINYGLEAELAWQASDSLSVFANIGLLQAEYRNFINGSHVDRNSETGEGVNMSGRAQAHAPEYQFFTGAQWRLNSIVSLRFEVEGKDAFYFSNNHEERSQSYALVNLRSEYKLGNTLIALWVKNLNDETVETRGFYFSHDFGNDPRKFYAPEPYTQKGAPRTFGVSVQHQF
jgi:iron complex outermembrane receptor protein